MILQDHLSHRFLFILIDGFRYERQPFFLIRERLIHPICNVADVLISNGFFIRKNRLLHFLLRNQLIQTLYKFLRNRAMNIFMLRLSDFRHNFLDEINDLKIHLMCHINGLQHAVFRNFIGSCFDHNHLLAHRSNGQAQISLIPCLLSGVDKEFSVLHPDLCHGTGSVKGNIRDRSRNAGTDHRHKLRSAFRIYRHHHVLNGNIISVILRKQRSHRPVNHSAGKNSILRRLSFPLVKTARKSANRIKFFHIFYTKRKKINSISRLLGCSRRAQNSCVPILHKSTAVCLFANLSNFHPQGSPREIHRISIHQFSHPSFLMRHSSHHASVTLDASPSYICFLP